MKDLGQEEEMEETREEGGLSSVDSSTLGGSPQSEPASVAGAPATTFAELQRAKLAEFMAKKAAAAAEAEAAPAMTAELLCSKEFPELEGTYQGDLRPDAKKIW
eukprot:1739682-Rhodomonas_salina.1